MNLDVLRYEIEIIKIRELIKIGLKLIKIEEDLLDINVKGMNLRFDKM